MNDNEIIKALELCNNGICKGCPYYDVECCIAVCRRDALNLIKQQQAKIEALINGQETLQKHIAEKNAEIENLKKTVDNYVSVLESIEKIKSKAYKELAEGLKEKLRELGRFVVYNEDIDNLVKELTEVKDDE